MKITFNHLQDNHTQISKAGEMAGNMVKSSKVSDQNTSVSGILFGKGQDRNAYGKQTKSAQEIKDQAGLLDASDYKNYMAVMASSMSGEDFSALVEEGVKPGKTEVHDMVTIMDHIKTVMAKSGVVIEGFNAGGDISMEKLEAMTGNAAYAQQMANAFAENDVPLTEENVEEAMKQSDLALDITGLSDHVKQYMVENNCEFTIDQIYKAKYSTQSGEQSGAKGSYFADDLNGYFGKTTETADVEAMAVQIEKVIQEAGLEVSEQTKTEASWMLDKGMLLTGENLEKLHRMNNMEFPITREDALSHIAQALREGKAAKDADLSRDGIFKQAQTIKEMVDRISPEAVTQVVRTGKSLNIRNLSGAQRSIDAAMSVQASLQIQSTGMSTEITVNMEASLVHAQRTLEEVRLQMTVSANIMLLKSDYAIDTAPLTDLVDELKAAEQKMAQTQGLSLPKAEDNDLFTDTMAKTTAIRQMPAAVLGRVAFTSEQFTLSHVYEEGRILESTYKKAGESYEALMTAPRADFGDRLSDAFSNVDDILEDLNFDLTQDNRKAVRVLAYNKMELTAENITAVRAADADLTYLLNKMTPSATLSMIREGINPLKESVQELTDYFMQQSGELTQQAESFSKFLYQMEQNDQITAEERETYIGIYRLIRQIEKGDGKAIGTIVANGQELTFANLLSAVRTGQKRGIDATIDDDFGLLEKTQQKGTSISDQINRYYETKAAKLLEQMDPLSMAQGQVTMDTTWDALMEISENIQSDESAYRKEQLTELRNQLQSGAESVEFLLTNGQAVTPDHLGAAEKLNKKRGQVFRELADMFAEEEEMLAKLESIKENFTDAQAAQETYESMQAAVSEHLEESMYTEEKGFLDIRAIAALSKQLSLAENLAKEESYELPVVIDGQMTSVNVRFRKDAQGEIKNTVSVFVELSGGEKITAEWKLHGENITGYVGCDSREKAAQLDAKCADFIQNILSETGKTADIKVVYSKEVKAYERLEQAGKPVRSADDLNKTDKSEELQGRLSSAKELYQTAKAFIDMLEVPA